MASFGSLSCSSFLYVSDCSVKCPLRSPWPGRRKQKENQEDLLRRVNDATLAALTSARGGAGDGGRSGRRISDLCAYKAPADVPHARDLAVQARPPDTQV